jgi:hypothetical protein
VRLDGVQATALGSRGGYDYSVYAHLPAAPTPISKETTYEIGEFGSFVLDAGDGYGFSAIRKDIAVSSDEAGESASPVVRCLRLAEGRTQYRRAGTDRADRRLAAVTSI